MGQGWLKRIARRLGRDQGGWYSSGSGGFGAWVSYLVAWTSTGVAPAIGNGTLFGQFKLAGKMCVVEIALIAGGTTTFGTGDWSLSLPFSAASHGGSFHMTGAGRLIDLTVGHTGAYVINGTDATKVRIGSNMGIPVTLIVDSDTPFIWASGDELHLSFTYETV